MTAKNLFKSIILSCLFSSFSLQGCMNLGSPTHGVITHIQSDTTVLLKTDKENSPTCQVSIDFAFLEPSSSKDSLSQQINKTLLRTAFGTTYITMSPDNAVPSVRKALISKYRKNVLDYYTADLRRGLSQEEMPPWYNHKYSISSKLKVTRDSIYNYSVVNFEFTGGAHPNTVLKWTNINRNTGRELKKEDIFQQGTEKNIISLIEKQLVAEVNRRLETDTISSLQGLRENGLMLNVDLYIPNNFLVTDKGIVFLYNQYEIAPYAMGDFQLSIPYQEIKQYIKI